MQYSILYHIVFVLVMCFPNHVSSQVGNSDTDLLIGKWDGQNRAAYLEFLDDGVALGGYNSLLMIEGQYDIDDNGILVTEFRLVFRCYCNSSFFRFEDNGNTLVLSGEEDDETYFIRIDSVLDDE